MQITLDPGSVDDYRRFLAIKQLPSYQIRGRLATFPDEYAERIGVQGAAPTATDYQPENCLFDYQRDITETAIRRKRFSVFADCGLGKTLIILSYARHVVEHERGKVLILTPPLVIPQMLEESERFFPGLPIRQVKANQLAEWLVSDGNEIGITNYEALKDDTPQGNLSAIIADESSILKGHYGKYAQIMLRLGRGLEWKLCATGTPAPNDRIEYANHAVFMDRVPTVNAFLAKYFVNRGETGNRWELKPHALRPFYRSLSDWCIFLSDPSVYGWKDNTEPLPPIHVHISDVPLTADQKRWVNTNLRSLVATRTGGITMRSAYGQVSKGQWKGQQFATNKPAAVAEMISGWRESESTIVWCLYDHEQESVSDAIGGSAESMSGKTPNSTRTLMIDRFKSRETDTIVSKSRILGFGLNLQVATRQVFSGLADSYESYYQAVKRSNRIGSHHELNVHIPVTELELPMVENVLRKADRIDADTREQEQLFSESR